MGTYMSPAVQILAEDKDLIVYRKSLKKITGSVTSAILLQQILYRALKNDGKPFYKFKEPCDHEHYREGDSWAEELEFTRYEFDGALEKIGTKITKDTKEEVLTNGDSTKALVLFWTDMARLTWYQINFPLLNKLIEEAYLGSALRKGENQLYVKGKTSVTYSGKPALYNGENPLYITGNFPLSIKVSETTTETTTETTKEEDKQKNSASSSFEKLTVEKFVDLYNVLKPDECPGIGRITYERKRKYQKYVNQFPLVAYWETVFDEMNRSPFLRGFKASGDRPPVARGLDWLCQRGKDDVENCQKTFEGKYRDRTDRDEIVYDWQIDTSNHPLSRDPGSA